MSDWAEAPDQRTMDAVLRQLQILTESSKRISLELKAAWPGFCNVVVHDYLGIRVERIWPIVRDDIPKLKAQISRHSGRYGMEQVVATLDAKSTA